MAKAANAASVAESRRGPNYKAALSILRSSIPEQKTRVGRINEAIGELYGKLEGSHKVNKVGAQMFAKLDAIEDDAERSDVFRSLMGLIMVSGWQPLGGDLVDQAQNAECDPRIWWNRDHPDAKVDFAGSEGDDGDDDDDAGEKTPPADKPADKPVEEPVVEAKTKPKKLSVADARKAAKSHLSVVTSERIDPDADLADGAK